MRDRRTAQRRGLARVPDSTMRTVCGQRAGSRRARLHRPFRASSLSVTTTSTGSAGEQLQCGLGAGQEGHSAARCVRPAAGGADRRARPARRRRRRRGGGRAASRQSRRSLLSAGLRAWSRSGATSRIGRGCLILRSHVPGVCRVRVFAPSPGRVAQPPADPRRACSTMLVAITDRLTLSAAARFSSRS